MKAAVLMSTYNGARFIREQLDSILDQTGEFELDLWVRDDGSTDGTKDILNDYESRGLLRWYTGENLGPAQSFLDLVRRTLGYDWYAFADQDDFWMPENCRGRWKLWKRSMPPGRMPCCIFQRGAGG